MTWKHPRQGAAGHVWYEMEGTIYEHHWIVLVQWGQLTCETPCPSMMSNTGRVGGICCRKNSNHCRNRSLLIQPLLLLTKRVCAIAPSRARKLAGGNCFRGKIIIGGNTKPDAEAHDNTVWVFAFSPDVMTYIFLCPSSATTLPGLCTTLTPVSLQLYTYIGFDIRFNLPYIAPSFPKKKNPLWSPCLHSEHENMREVEGYVLLI